MSEPEQFCGTATRHAVRVPRTPFVLSRVSSSTQAIPQGVWRGPHGWQPSAWASRLCSAHERLRAHDGPARVGEECSGGQRGPARLSLSPAVAVRERARLLSRALDVRIERWMMVDLLDQADCGMDLSAWSGTRKRPVPFLCRRQAGGWCSD